MCGIAGYSGDFEPSLLTRMNAVQSHRGPDGLGTWCSEDRRLGLAHTRLSIIDLSPRGHQPMWDTLSKAVIVYNGELYNYRELRTELGSKGVQFQSDSDTEVILNLYLQEGPAFIHRLNGIFAFALWDTTKQELLLARDPLGVKPLYYAHTARGLVFASELKAVLQSESVPRNIDPNAILSYLSYLYSPGERTPLKSVKKLLPGHFLRIRCGQLVGVERYYELPLLQFEPEPLKVETAIGELRKYLARAVERQMVADVPVGAFLSGGLDSSAIVAYAKDHARDGKLDCFTMQYDDDISKAEGAVPDFPYAQRVAEHLGVNLHTLRAGPESAFNLERMIKHLDEPQADLAALNVCYISELARDQGIKVLLSGAGGDDIFSGYRRHYALMMECYWSWMPRCVRKSLRLLGRGVHSYGHLGRRIEKSFHYADADEQSRLASYFLWVNPCNLAKLWGPLLHEELCSVDPREPLLQFLEETHEGQSPLNKMLFLEQKGFMVDHNLNYTDKMSMAASVETRVPLLDTDLVEFAAKLPVEYKQRGREGKWIFKKAMEGILPKDVIYRPKSGFLSPLRRGLHRELKPLVNDMLSPEVLRRRGLFDPQGVQQLLEQDSAGKLDASYTILGLICVEVWCRQFLDQSRPFNL